jgi:hypothetical protein
MLLDDKIEDCPKRRAQGRILSDNMEMYQRELQGRSRQVTETPVAGSVFLMAARRLAIGRACRALE